MNLARWRHGGLLLAAQVLCLPSAYAGDDTPDLWQRFCDARELTAQDPARVREAARWYARSPTHFRDLLHRAEPWMWEVMTAIEEYDMPIDLAALPAIESGFQPRAESDQSAGGLWQMIPATAKRQQLRMDGHIDERADVAPSTEAALNYLRYLQGRFNDWSITLAAYNAGEGRVARAILATGKRPGDAVTRREIDLPGETRAHYLRLLGFIEAVCHPSRYDLRRPTLPARRLHTRVTLDRAVTLSEVARLGGIPLSEMRRLNPALLQETTPPQGPHVVRIPSHRLAHFDHALQNVPDLAIARFTTHQVQLGDTLSVLARRFETTTRHLQELNGMQDTRIRAGATLKVPATAPRKL